MTRDFSEKAKQKLEGYADDAAASSTSAQVIHHARKAVIL